MTEEPTWAMQLALRIEKASPPTHLAICEAAAMAVVGLLTDPRSAPDGEWHDAVAAWEARHIRKVARRARGARWDALAALPGVLVDHDGAPARAFVPGPVTEVPPEISRLQVGGTDLARDDEPKPPPEPPYALVTLNPGVGMTTGKAAAQCGHAAQLLLRARGEWPGLRVRVLEADDWARSVAEADVTVRDGGFTEVAPGTMTAVARLIS
ncbi:peptidyl-tRNA hydrolase [Actinoallomurus purpureus]|uniref:peptidyl-tRNA hydrolase n=1 Tax=Actinoallomurus purpureus TaxID=478114 RepID=UPI002093608C|nr:peptidyl-tRNA hydrolase [Actinoallomurus purpureus]MCO6006486.1 peptidyl-tRNA hydrolase [Actinoallomurus purpureus]